MRVDGVDLGLTARATLTPPWLSRKTVTFYVSVWPEAQGTVDGYGGVQICVSPATEPLPLLERGEVDVGRVTKIEIVFVGDDQRG